MASVGNILLDKEILLESGTNELEVLVFNLADFTFGINVAKVREVLPAMRITELPRAHRSVRGVFKLRDRVIPCVSLNTHLGVAPTTEDAESTMILTDFNQQQTAFLVDEVERIHRLSWESVLGVPGLTAFANTPVTAVARCDNRLIVMLDFEMIIDQVTDSYFRIDEVSNPHGLPRDQLKVILADDSATVREAVSATLRNSGYTNLQFFENGAQAWNEIIQRFEAAGNVEGVADLLISDVEMPQIDGFHLTKRIKDHPQLKRLPVLLYSSIVTPDNHKKGKAVGADAQISKPELSKVVGMADDLILAAREGKRPAATSSVAAVAAAAPAPRPTPQAQDQAEAVTPANVPAARHATPVASASAASPVPQASVSPTLAESVASPATRQRPPESNVAVAPPAAPEPPAGSSQPAPDLLTPPRDTVISNIDPHLWRTFHLELRERVPAIQEIIARVDSGTVEDDVLNQALRLLHTIKSAAMVVPVDEITRVTHLVESQLADVRSRSGHWPLEGLRMYADWLGDLAANLEDPQATLALGPPLEEQLAVAMSV